MNWFYTAPGLVLILLSFIIFRFLVIQKFLNLSKVRPVSAQARQQWVDSTNLFLPMVPLLFGAGLALELLGLGRQANFAFGVGVFVIVAEGLALVVLRRALLKSLDRPLNATPRGA